MLRSFSRPRVSNDNTYSEYLFRTVKYRPDYPRRPFASMVDASAWLATFVDWYNQRHRHSGIRFVSPSQRHSGEATAISRHRMRVPIVTILGDTTSGKMSSSVVNAAGMTHLIARDIQEFAKISGRLAHDYRSIRANEAKIQSEVRSGILFDDSRICKDFYSLMNSLILHYVQMLVPGSEP